MCYIYNIVDFLLIHYDNLNVFCIEKENNIKEISKSFDYYMIINKIITFMNKKHYFNVLNYRFNSMLIVINIILEYMYLLNKSL